MAYRQSKGIDEGEDGSAMRHISRWELERCTGARHKNLERPDFSNVMVRSDVRRVMIAAKQKEIRFSKKKLYLG